MKTLPSLREVRDQHVIRVLNHCDRLKEAANILGCNVRTLRRWRRRLQIPKRTHSHESQSSLA